MVGGAVVYVTDAEHFVDVPRLVLTGERKPHDAFGDELRVWNRRKRKLFEHVGSLKTPFLAGDPEFEGHLDGVGVQYVAWKPVAGDVSVLVFAQDCYRGKFIFFWCGDAVPMIFEPLQCFGDTFVVGIQGEKQLASSFAHAVVEGRRFALVLLKNIADREIGLGLPLGNQRPGTVGGTVVNDEPFEIATRLPLQALVNAGECSRPVEGRRKHREQVFTAHVVFAATVEPGFRGRLQGRLLAVRSSSGLDQAKEAEANKDLGARWSRRTGDVGEAARRFACLSGT